MGNTILYIEDNPDNMLLVKRILQAGKYNLLEAQNGVQGLSMAENEDIDLVLLDVNLPDLDGYEVARRLRSSTRASVAQLPIIVLTANAMKGDAQKAMDAGCNVYMAKPINIFELLDKVNAFVRKEAAGNTL
jgi:two-component system cell cycle response regulator DivK